MYSERAAVIAALSKVFPASIEKDDEAEPEWKSVVYIMLPTGQVSWHIAEHDVWHFTHLPFYEGLNTWDGHNTEEKYRRLEMLEPRNS